MNGKQRIDRWRFKSNTFNKRGQHCTSWIFPLHCVYKETSTPIVKNSTKSTLSLSFCSTICWNSLVDRRDPKKSAVVWSDHKEGRPRHLLTFSCIFFPSKEKNDSNVGILCPFMWHLFQTKKEETCKGNFNGHTCPHNDEKNMTITMVSKQKKQYLHFGLEKFRIF